MILDLQNFELEHRMYMVFYASSNFIVYKQLQTINIQKCDGAIVSTIKCPPSWRHIECVELDDYVVLMLAGRYLIAINKADLSVIEQNIDMHKIGRCITKVFAGNQLDSIVFGTYVRGNIQFVTYDFINNKRLMQTCSLKMSNVIDTSVNNSHLYALYDNSYMVCYDLNTMESKWKRFESSQISPKLLVYNEMLLYTCSGLLKKVNNTNVSFMKLPAGKISSLESLTGDNLYYTVNDRKNLCCLDLGNEKTKWEMNGTDPINQTILLHGKHQNKTHDLLACLLPSHLAIVDLTLQQVFYKTKHDNIYKIDVTADHLLLRHYNNQTDMATGSIL